MAEATAMPEHVVRQGDCLSSISVQYGLCWQTIWNHPENAELRRLREDPNVLCPGDRLVIPERREKRESGGTEQRHRFRKRGVPAKLKIRLLMDDEPRANEPYRLRVDGVWKEGVTDAEGFLEESIPPNAQEGHLLVGEASNQCAYDFQFGSVDPLSTEEGVRGRLRDLGYTSSQDLSEAVKAFQERQGLGPTGQLDQQTRSALQREFGQ